MWCSHIRWCLYGAVTLGGVCVVQSLCLYCFDPELCAACGSMIGCVAAWRFRSQQGTAGTSGAG